MNKLMVLSCALLLGFAMNASADGLDRKVKFSIPAQSLSAALIQFSNQANVQVITRAEDVSSGQTRGVSGHMTVSAALRQLLSDTGFSYLVVGDDTVEISAADSRATQGIGTAQQPLVLAQAGAAPASADDRGNTAPDQSDESTELEEVVVTGTHLRGERATPSQILTIDRQAIERTGFSTVEEIMQSLPQNFADLTPTGRFATEGGSSLIVRNNDRVTSVNLRGLGALSTLTLVDGVRLAGAVQGRVVDVSMLPLSMIERVEVVTGGHSAIYGSDAVAGVSNFRMRRDFSGAQSQLYYGGSSNGGERLQASQLVGMRFERGGFAAGYDFSRDWAFDLGKAGLLSPQFSPLSFRRQLGLQAQSDTWRHSALVSGHFSPSDRIEFRGNALYANKRYVDEESSVLLGSDGVSNAHSRHPAELYGVSGGALISLAGAWRLNITAADSASDIEWNASSFENYGGGAFDLFELLRRDRSTVSSLSAVADGQLPRLGGITPKTALGVEVRDEELRERVFQTTNDIESLNVAIDGSRTVRSAFAEVLLPIAQDRLELSIAGRYDHYSDFGDTTNPQFGVLWQPVDGMRFRGSYSRAFRAPALFEMGDIPSGFMATVADPQSLSGTRELVVLAGGNPDLGPEKSEGWSFGVEFQPPSWVKTSASIGYFDVKYTDRIEAAIGNFAPRVAALTQEDQYQQIIDRHPDPVALQEVLDDFSSFFNLSGVSFQGCNSIEFCETSAAGDFVTRLLAAIPDVVVLDDRTQNIAIDQVRGLDLILKSGMTTSVGELTYGLNMTYTLDHDRNVTPTSPAFSLLNQVGKPVDLRARAELGWLRGPYGMFGYVNYTDSYADPFSTPTGKIAPWTTLDLTARLDGSQLSQSGLLAGLVATLSVDNALDKKPPRYENSSFGVLYDSTNADPFGRYFSLRLIKSW